MKRAAVAALFTSVLSIGVSYAAVLIAGTAPSWAVWLLLVGTSAAMVATAALGAAGSMRRSAGSARLAIPLAAVFALLVAAFGLALLLPAEAEPLWLGLPRRTAIVIYGVGLLPALFLPLAYAATFDESSLDDGELKRIAELRPRDI